MKSILIPTTFEQDLTDAVATAIEQASGTHCTITLLSVKEAEDTFSAGYTLYKMQQGMTHAQIEVSEKCKALAAAAQNCHLQTRYQHGLSGPLLKNLLEYLGTDLVIITRSYRKEKQKMHSYCLGLLLKCRKPILQLGKETKHTLSNALYIEHDSTTVDTQELHHLLNGTFNLKIVSSAKLNDGQSIASMEGNLMNAIQENKIDVVIETRKPVKAKVSGVMASESLGLPVLSIHE